MTKKEIDEMFFKVSKFHHYLETLEPEQMDSIEGHMKDVIMHYLWNIEKKVDNLMS